MKIDFLDIDVNKITTASKMDVYVINDVEAVSYYAACTTNYGSNDVNVVDKKGIAHFLEHVMFATKSGDYFDEFSKYNASANAYTSYNQTTYLFSCESNFIENLNILSNLVTTNDYSVDTVKKEFEIISEEIKIYDNEPFWNLRNIAYESMCTNSNYRYDIAGTIESICEITKEDLDNVFNRCYCSSNQYVVLYGNFEDFDFSQMDGLFNTKNSEEVFKKELLVEDMNINFSSKFERSKSVDSNYGLTSLKLPINKESAELDYLAWTVFLETYFTDLSMDFLNLKQSKMVSPNLNYSIVFEHDISYIQFSYQGNNLKQTHNNVLDYLENIELNSVELQFGLNNVRAQEIYDNDSLEYFAKNFVHHVGDVVDVFEFYRLLKDVRVEELESRLAVISNQYIATQVAIVKEDYYEE